MKAELMAMNSRMNIKQEWISDLEDWIISIILSGQQTESQMKKKQLETIQEMYGIV